MSPSPRAAPGRAHLIALLRSGSPLAVATALAGLLSYAFNLILTRALGPEQYGSVGSLLGIAVIATVPMTALQLEVARTVAGGTAPAASRLIRDASLVSAATAGVALAAAPLFDQALHLDTTWDAVYLALLLFPQTLSGGLLGILLGRSRLWAFSLALVGIGVMRLLAGALTAALHGGPTMAMGTAAAGSLLGAGGALLGVLLTDPHDVPARPLPARTAVANLARAAGGAASLMVVLNLDLLAARVLLDVADSGKYAFLTLFGRITFWGTSFLSLWIYPRIASSGHQHRAIRTAAGLVAIGGTGALLVSLLVGEQLVRALAGSAYAGAGTYAPLFSLAGALMSVVQLAIYVEVARARHRLTIAVWGGCLAMVVLYALLPVDSITGVVVVAIGTLLVLAAVSGRALLRTHTPQAAADYRQPIAWPTP